MNAVSKIEAGGNIYTALAAAQSEFGQVTKGATNPAFKSKYANLSDVAGVVIPTLNRHGVAVLHYMVGENLSAMRTSFYHGASDTFVNCDVPLIVDKNNMQGMKSATTYAKRIGLESLSGIAPEDDDGNAAAEAPPPERITAQDDAFARIAMLVKATGSDIANICKAAKVQNIDQLSPTQADKVIDKLEAKLAAAAKAETDKKQLSLADELGDDIPY